MTLNKDELGEHYGKVGVGNQNMLGIMGNNRDVSVGEIFMIYSCRDGHERIFFFRVLGLQNYIRQVDDLSRIAGTMMVESDAYLSGIERNMLLSVDGKMLGYAEEREGEWKFHSPRRLPDHLADVIRPVRGQSDPYVREMLKSQTDGEVYIGDLQIGEESLDVPVTIPAKFLPMHVGIFGSTGSGKSNLMMVLVKAMIDTNMKAQKDPDVPKISAFCIDPHDEFALGVDKYGIQDIVEAMDAGTRKTVLGDFYYLTTHLAATQREVRRYGKEIRILWNEITPRDLFSIMDFTSQMASFIEAVRGQHGENWISEIVNMSEDPDGTPAGTLRGVQRRLRFLTRSPIFVESGTSVLDDIFEAMETGRILVVNTSLMSNREQFLLTTIATRTLSDLRRALKSSGNLGDFERQAKLRLPPSFFSRVRAKARTFYSKSGNDDQSPVKDPRNLPVIQITVEEAPSILNPDLMRGESVFKDISRQGRKFNIGLLVVSQQVSVLDNVILSQMNTEINLRLGNEREIRACIENASVNITGFENEFRVMSRGEAIVTASYRELPLPVKIPLFDKVFERDKASYKATRTKKKQEKHVI
ncbi:MAG: ATP-binding protein [Candidatus Thorarchaeota archaeon]|nr:ATP-binding protein [Candidatus Thorarchaeota archaeon]MCK5239123.1 ATP-binding protein [Candidatus Thorarchaeota archaeon]